MVYNEQANIGQLLKTILEQIFLDCQLKEIIVVASGCTDDTINITRRFSKNDSRIKLMIQQKREGKASAINLFLSKATGDILILESGDTIPGPDSLSHLIAPFKDPNVGMTGACPVPVNPDTTFIGFAVNLMWSLHHQISLSNPKMGELIAFRNFVHAIPNDTAVDEAWIEAVVKMDGYIISYVPEAVVKNKGPENIKDFLRQRRRIAAGHKHLYYELKHKVSTHNPLNILKILMKEHSWNKKKLLWLLGIICLEGLGRALGYFDFCVLRKKPFIWKIASSTKNLN